MRPVERRVLVGRRVRLEPLGSAHAELDLITEAFDYLPEYPEDFAQWFAPAQRSRDPLFFAAVVDGRAAGRMAIQRIDLPNGVAEVGHILWGPQMRRTPASTEAVFLVVDHLFSLGARRVEWKCDNRNEGSKAAALRFGFTFEGVFRQHMLVKGENRDTAWFSLLDREWPQRRRVILTWLQDTNFDDEGRQIVPLRTLRAP
jgi:RimJ/RimL family protein N-acetyltransferase